MLGTLEKDAVKPTEPARGQRLWTHAEAFGDACFIVECTVGREDTGLRLRRFMTTDFWQARSIHRNQSYVRARLFGYFRAPVEFASGYIFEPIEEVYRIGDGDSDKLLYKFQSGVVMMAGNKVISERPLQFGRKVFPN